MPYIKQSDRDYYEKEINALVDKLTDYFATEPTKIAGNRAGHLNYIFFSIIKRFYNKLAKKLGLSVRYADYNEIVGLMECCKIELYRRLASPYEDEKIQENGDV